MNITLGEIQRAVNAARKRLGDDTIGAQIHNGQLQIVRVTYPDFRKTGNVSPMTEFLPPLDAIAFLDGMQGPCRVNLLSKGGLDIANGSLEMVIGNAVLTIEKRGATTSISVYRVGSRTREARRWPSVTPGNLRAALTFADRINDPA